MKIAVINGIPGTGKTEVAHILEKRIEDSEVIHLDMYGGKNPPISEYKKNKIYKSIIESKKDLIIIEGFTYEQAFLSKLEKIADTLDAEYFYFELRRNIDRILQIPSRRERNTKENLLELVKKLESLKISNKRIISKYGFYHKSKVIKQYLTQ